MADDSPEASAPAEAAFSDDAWSATDGTRAAAKWIASALGAIPSLAVVASVVRTPGDSGFDAETLAWGVGLAAAGAVIGILGFAAVLNPVKLEDDKLSGFDMTRVMGNTYETFTDLTKRIGEVRDAVVNKETDLAGAESRADTARSTLATSGAEVTRLKADLGADPENEELKRRVAKAEVVLRGATAVAESEAAAVKDEQRGVKYWSTQHGRLSALRRQVYRLKASDVVTRRFWKAAILTVPSVGLVAAGIVVLGLAPNPKAQVPDPSSLVTLVLNDAGKAALGCEEAELQGVRVGGTDAAPMVITFPTENCLAQTMTFTTEEPEAFGTVTVEETVP